MGPRVDGPEQVEKVDMKVLIENRKEASESAIRTHSAPTQGDDDSHEYQVVLFQLGGL